jgi:hypothetical protein
MAGIFLQGGKAALPLWGSRRAPAYDRWWVEGSHLPVFSGQMLPNTYRIFQPGWLGFSGANVRRVHNLFGV